MIEIFKNFLQNNNIIEYELYTEENSVTYTIKIEDSKSYLGYRFVNVELDEILIYLWKNQK